MFFDECKYREYANHFWDVINNTFWHKRGVLGYLPIVFAELPKEKAMKYIQGATSIHIHEKKQVYSCFPIVFIRPDNTDSQLRETIRHEIIHYFLALHYYNHNDNSALFSLICSLFDGGAYETLTEKGQIIYDAAKPYLTQAYALYSCTQENNSKSKMLSMQLSLMLMEIDEAEHNQDSNAKSLESSLSLILKVCETNISR